MMWTRSLLEWDALIPVLALSFALAAALLGDSHPDRPETILLAVTLFTIL